MQFSVATSSPSPFLIENPSPQTCPIPASLEPLEYLYCFQATAEADHHIVDAAKENFYIFGSSPFLMVVYLGLHAHQLAFHLAHMACENEICDQSGTSFMMHAAI